LNAHTTATAQVAGEGISFAQVDVQTLRAALREQGAIVDKEAIIA
jgi:hypothetical protein